MRGRRERQGVERQERRGGGKGGWTLPLPVAKIPADAHGHLQNYSEPDLCTFWRHSPTNSVT